MLLRYTAPEGWALTTAVYEEICCGIAGVCIIALLIRGGKFAARVCTNMRRGKHW